MSTAAVMNMTPGYIGYHEPGSKWHLAPNFTSNALNENDSIEHVINLILNAKNKNLENGHKQQLIKTVEKAINGTTVKFLNKLNDTEWENLQCIPLICKVYLRHLLSQSFKYKTKQQLLEHDFNWGIEINWNHHIIKPKINQLIQFGFSHEDACEAVIVTENKSVDAAVNYALMDVDARKKEYNRVKARLNRQKIRTLRDEDYIDYISAFNKHDLIQRAKEENLGKEWRRKLREINRKRRNSNSSKDKSGTAEILREVEKYKQQVADLKRKRRKMEEEVKRIRLKNKLELYENYVNGMLSGNSLNVEQISEWKKYRHIHNITESEHNLILNKFGYKNDDDLDKIKTYIMVEHDHTYDGGENDMDGLKRTTSNSSSCSLKDSITKPTPSYNCNHGSPGRKMECVICYESMGEDAWILLPCNHICICGECAQNYYPEPHKDQKCPLDCQDVVDVKKVYFS